MLVTLALAVFFKYTLTGLEKFYVSLNYYLYLFLGLATLVFLVVKILKNQEWKSKIISFLSLGLVLLLIIEAWTIPLLNPEFITLKLLLFFVLLLEIGLVFKNWKNILEDFLKPEEIVLSLNIFNLISFFYQAFITKSGDVSQEKFISFFNDPNFYALLILTYFIYFIFFYRKYIVNEWFFLKRISLDAPLMLFILYIFFYSFKIIQLPQSFSTSHHLLLFFLINITYIPIYFKKFKLNQALLYIVLVLFIFIYFNNHSIVIKDVTLKYMRFLSLFEDKIVAIITFIGTTTMFLDGFANFKSIFFEGNKEEEKKLSQNSQNTEG